MMILFRVQEAKTHSDVSKFASYGLNIWSKWDKLSTDQATLIKELSNDSEITTNYIFIVYSVSSSVVNKIKRSTLIELSITRAKNSIKHFGTRKVNPIKSIQEFVKNNSSTCTAKEVAS